MHHLMLVLLAIFTITVGAQDLREFSTSMDFGEFAVVLGHLIASDASLSAETATNIADFRMSTVPGNERRFELRGAPGYMALEREDDQSFSIAIFTIPDVLQKLDVAYDSAGKELSIW